MFTILLLSLNRFKYGCSESTEKWHSKYHNKHDYVT